ncbi:MAG TPA: FCD domain-containing protein [Acidimicrobiales bacterium]|nr:FCD domain-containing protein [Acidimicrobiales bacterium]
MALELPEPVLDDASDTLAAQPDLRVAPRVGPHHATEQRRSQKTSERVALDIVHDIVAQGLRVGDRLPLEAEMVEQYQVSRASLREALRLLEVQGLIRLKPGPGGGPVVGSVEAANLARTASLYFHLGASTYGQLFETQVLLEPIAAQLAAQHPDRRAAMKPFTHPDAPSTESDYRHQTTDFHEAVYKLAANPVLVLVTSAVTHIVSDHVIATMDPVALRPSILDEHVAMARAIAAGQPQKARHLMAAHFQAQHDFYREHWPARLLELIEWR